jgi:flagellar motor switch/type III secretory pathway protein FliN
MGFGLVPIRLSRFWSSYCFDFSANGNRSQPLPPVNTPTAPARFATRRPPEGRSWPQNRLWCPSPQPPIEGASKLQLTEPVAQLPVELEVAVPVRDFRVRNLLSLEPGQVIETQWAHGEDMPLSAGDVQLAWSEFEVVDTQLAVRLTRLA